MRSVFLEPIIRPPKESFIAIGADSSVHRFGDDHVIKVYEKGLDPHTLSLYKSLTDCARKLLTPENSTGTISIAKEKFPYEIDINPILTIGTLADGFSYSTSRYIPGFRLRTYTDLISRLHYNVDITKANSTGREAFLARLANSPRSIANKRYTDRGPYPSDIEFMNKLFKELNTGCNTTVFDVNPVNSKAQFDLESRTFLITVTDLCGFITDCRPIYHDPANYEPSALF